MTVPIGGIIWWNSSLGSIPSGFYLCNGTNGTIDLRDKFVPGAGSSYSPGNTGGALSHDLTHTHGQGTFTATTSINHFHDTYSVSGQTDDAVPAIITIRGFDPPYPPGPDEADAIAGDDTHYHTWDNLVPIGGGEHSHPVSVPSTEGEVVDNRPPYYALYLIQRIS